MRRLGSRSVRVEGAVWVAGNIAQCSFALEADVQCPREWLKQAVARCLKQPVCTGSPPPKMQGCGRSQDFIHTGSGVAAGHDEAVLHLLVHAAARLRVRALRAS